MTRGGRWNTFGRNTESVGSLELNQQGRNPFGKDSGEGISISWILKKVIVGHEETLFTLKDVQTFGEVLPP